MRENRVIDVIKISKKLGLLLFIVLFAGSSKAQLVTQIMWCVDEVYNISFEAHFNKNIAIVTLKGYTYKLPYTESYVGKYGVRWSVYRNRELDVSAATEKHVQIWNASGKLIAAADCKIK